MKTIRVVSVKVTNRRSEGKIFATENFSTRVSRGQLRWDAKSCLMQTFILQVVHLSFFRINMGNKRSIVLEWSVPSMSQNILQKLTEWYGVSPVISAIFRESTTAGAFVERASSTFQIMD